MLLLNETRWGRAALYNIPPTAVRRQDQYNRVAYGRASISRLINEATRLVLRHLSDPGRRDQRGQDHRLRGRGRAAGISSWREDAHPFPARAIQPVITINLPGVDVGGIRCEKEFAIPVDRTSEVSG